MAACNRGTPNNDALRQGVVDYLARVGLNVAGMDVTVTSVQMNGKEADTAVSITAKGGNSKQGMQLRYRLEQRDGKWVVVGRQDSSQHGLGAAPQNMPGPHGGGRAPDAASPAPTPGATSPGAARPGAGGPMPSPEDLPPVPKKP